MPPNIMPGLAVADHFAVGTLVDVTRGAATGMFTLVQFTFQFGNENQIAAEEKKERKEGEVRFAIPGIVGYLAAVPMGVFVVKIAEKTKWVGDSRCDFVGG